MKLHLAHCSLAARRDAPLAGRGPGEGDDDLELPSVSTGSASARLTTGTLADLPVPVTVGTSPSGDKTTAIAYDLHGFAPVVVAIPEARFTDYRDDHDANADAFRCAA